MSRLHQQCFTRARVDQHQNCITTLDTLEPTLINHHDVGVIRRKLPPRDYSSTTSSNTQGTPRIICLARAICALHCLCACLSTITTPLRCCVHDWTSVTIRRLCSVADVGFKNASPRTVISNGCCCVSHGIAASTKRTYWRVSSIETGSNQDRKYDHVQ